MIFGLNFEECPNLLPPTVALCAGVELEFLLPGTAAD
jgi:hypothetical protein